MLFFRIKCGEVFYLFCNVCIYLKNDSIGIFKLE